MSEDSAVVDETATDVGEYCRRLEAHLTKVNAGQIIRIVGPAFELVRGWAREGIPVSVVCHGIDRKAERHRAGRAHRALRLEFCEPDVIAVYRQWQRAVGLSRPAPGPADSDPSASAAPSRGASSSRHLDRAMDKLAAAVGQLGRSEAFRDAGSAVLQQLGALRDALRTARGAQRRTVLDQLPPLDAQLLAAAREEAGTGGMAMLEAQASEELAPYRTRLTHTAWAESVRLSSTRLLRGRFGLPTLVDE